MDHTLGLEALKAAADQGRDLYHKNKDPQGFLKEGPKRDSVPLTEYDAVMKALYEAAYRAAENTPAWNFVTLEDFSKELAKDSLHGAAQISTAIRNAYDVRQKEPTQTSVAPPADITSKDGFTEEEIAFVRSDKFSPHFTFAEMAEEYRDMPNWHGKGFRVAGHDPLRLASCAEYLANMEGQGMGISEFFADNFDEIMRADDPMETANRLLLEDRANKLAALKNIIREVVIEVLEEREANPQ